MENRNDGGRAYLEKQDQTGRKGYSRGNRSDLSTHALKLKNSGAEAVIMWTNPTAAALILAETAKIGFKPQWATSNTLSDAALMMQITKGLWGGMIHSNFGELPDSNIPLMVNIGNGIRNWRLRKDGGHFTMQEFSLLNH